MRKKQTWSVSWTRSVIGRNINFCSNLDRTDNLSYRFIPKNDETQAISLRQEPKMIKKQPVDIDTLCDEICKAIAKKITIQFVVKEATISFEPYILFREKDINWVQGFESGVDFHLSAALRKFDISTISSVKLTEKTFTPHSNFHPVITSTTHVYCRIKQP